MKTEFLSTIKLPDGRINSRRLTEQYFSRIGKLSLWQDMIDCTSFVDDSYSLLERIYFYENDITSRPICSVCGGDDHVVLYDRYKNARIGGFCSKICFNNDPNKSEKNKIAFTKVDKQSANAKRKVTMNLLYGCDTNSQRPEIKKILKKSKLIDTNPNALDMLLNQEWLVEEYITKDRSVIDISSELGVDYTTIFAYLNSHNIPLRKITRAHIKYSENGELIRNKQWLFDQYVIQNKSSTEIADFLACTKTTILRYLKAHDIPRNTGRVVSSQERKIRTLLDSLGIFYISSDRTLIAPYELDIYIPSHNIAIEVNGLYWHSEFFKDTNYHAMKREMCSTAGIRLINLYEDTINFNFDIITRYLKNIFVIDGAESRVFARKCKIVHEPSKKDCDWLLNTFHVQGTANSNRRIGLEYNGKLVAVMLFVGNILTRYATSVKVPGGFTKLLKSSGMNEITTFVDMDMFNGKTYFDAGFVIDEYLKPDYKYIVNGVRIHKFNYRKCRFRSDDNLIFDHNMTEHELAKSNKIYRIYDSGKYRLKYSRQ